MMTQTAIVWFGIHFISAALGSSICHGIYEEKPSGSFSTKTAYFNVHKDASQWRNFQEEVNGCTPMQVWLLVRHGTRYPTGNDFNRLMDDLPRLSGDVVTNHKNGKGCLKDGDVRQLADWFPNYDKQDMEQLHQIGFQELNSIGEYWRNLFPDLFNVPYNKQDFKIDYTIKNRTGQSAYHFLQGMFGEDAVGKIELPEPRSPNFVIRFYKSCPKWLREVYKNQRTTYKERLLFSKSNEFNEMAEAVSSRLGFSKPLFPKQIESMYDECRYETAWWPEHQSAWCSAFTHQDLMVMEFYTDLKYYYEDSFGTELNGETACETLSDIYSHFSASIASNSSSPRGIFYFGHDKGIFQLLTRIGLFRPEQHLRHDNFHNMKSRNWRSSYVSPFAANFGMVLYRCASNTHRIGSFFHGNPVHMTERCRHVACQWQELLPWLKQNYATCDIQELCRVHDEL